MSIYTQTRKKCPSKKAQEPTKFENQLTYVRDLIGGYGYSFVTLPCGHPRQTSGHGEKGRCPEDCLFCVIIIRAEIGDTSGWTIRDDRNRNVTRLLNYYITLCNQRRISSRNWGVFSIIHLGDEQVYYLHNLDSEDFYSMFRWSEFTFRFILVGYEEKKKRLL